MITYNYDIETNKIRSKKQKNRYKSLPRSRNKGLSYVPKLGTENMLTEKDSMQDNIIAPSHKVHIKQ